MKVKDSTNRLGRNYDVGIILCAMQELFGGYDGVKLLIDYLKRDIDKFGSGLGHHRLLLAAVDCVWCTVVGNAVVEDMFLEQEGVLILLDVLNVSNTHA